MMLKRGRILEMKYLKYIAATVGSIGLIIGLLIGVTILIAPWLDGPVTRIAGGPFKQPSETGVLPADSLTSLATIELEVMLSSRPSVNVAVIVHEGEVYLPATLKPAEKRWPKAIIDDARIRVRFADRVYDYYANKVNDQSLHLALSAVGASKYSRAYFIPEKTWFFHLTPR